MKSNLLKLRSKIDLVSHPACVEGLDNTYIQYVWMCWVLVCVQYVS